MHEPTPISALPSIRLLRGNVAHVWPFDRHKWSQSPGWWRRSLARFGAWCERLLSKGRSPEYNLDVAQRVLAQAVRTGGPDSRFTVNAMWEVAQRLDKVGRPVEALILRQQIVDRMREHLGEQDLETVQAEQWLAASLLEANRAEEAQPLLEHVVTTRELLLGLDHPHTVSAMEWLVRAKNRNGDQ